MLRRGGHALVSVPIEIGIWGIAKFLVKTPLYGYSMDELPGADVSGAYVGALLRGRDISRFRAARAGWGTHFGFDYREVDRLLREQGAHFRARNVFTTRYYVISVARR